MSRCLAEGEVVALTGGSNGETLDAVWRVKGRILGDTLVVWFTMKDQSLKRLSPTYKCLSATAIHDRFAVGASQVVHRLEVGLRLQDQCTCFVPGGSMASMVGACETCSAKRNNSDVRMGTILM